MDSRTIAVILDDDARRVEAMRDVLGEHFSHLRPRVFATAPESIQWLAAHLDEAALITLDHDLDPLEDPPPETDPGTGRDVADFLAANAPICPVIIHSSNVDGVGGMRRVLEEAGWSVRVVAPLNDLAWIPNAWAAAVRAAVACSD